MFLILFLFSSIQFLINTPFLDTDTKIPINRSPYPPTSIIMLEIMVLYFHRYYRSLINPTFVLKFNPNI